MATLSQVRQNFHSESEDAINNQINLELKASYVYLSMAYHFHRDDVALQGFYKEFKHRSDEEREHAYKFMEFLNKRGGRIVLKAIPEPSKQSWATAKEAMEDALKIEKEVNESLLALHRTAGEHNDANLCDFLEENYLQDQVDDIKQIGDHLTNLERVGEGLGVYIFDQRLQS